MSAVYQLYNLVDPRNNEVFYVGIGQKGRAQSHLGTTKNMIRNGSKLKGRHVRIAELLEAGLEHAVVIVKTGMTKDQALADEIAMIEKLGRADQGRGPLLNRTKGGQWIADCPRTEEWLANMSASQKIAQNNPATKAAKSKALLGRKRTPEQVENIRQSQLAIGDRVSKARMGAGNPAAKPCIVNGVRYGSQTDAANALGVKPWMLRKKFKVDQI